VAVLGEFPSWLDVDFTRSAAVFLAVFATVVLVAVIFTVRSVATRLVVVALLAASVFGLLHYRADLEHCDRNGCSCKLFGQQLEGGRCNT
jgi:asparagine N-glycosylation enzyme membrane subunit Stt3